MRPPLVFWINRDSFMAGGLILFPSRHADESLPLGNACAEALGLTHFVVWSPREISFWQTGASPSRQRTLLFQDSQSSSAEEFRGLLLQIMEELKVPAVTGAVPVPSLSAYYFLNLCIETLEEITPSLISTFRVRLGEQFLPGRNSTPETLAIRKAALVLMRLL
ncbi:MAG TPA: hypothetical protein VJ955_06850, partial [Desulfuromonadales bacterium]|nr:hypothetical protein [Desulfuromonadales bacterium]